MTWQLLTAICVIALSASVVLQRILIHKDKIDSVAYAVFFQGLVGVLILIVALFRGFSLPNIGSVALPAVASLFLYGAGHIVYAKALQRTEASIFSILFATQAIWVMLLGVLIFKENLSLLQLFGSLLIFCGVALVVKDFRKFSFDKGTALSLLTGVLFGFAITCWSYVGRHTDTLSWAGIGFIGCAAAALMFGPKAITRMGPLMRVDVLSKLVLLAAIYAIGSVAMLFAYKLGDFSIVSPLRQTGIIVTMLLALLFLPGERSRIGWKIAAAIVAFIGVLLIIV